MANDGRTQFLEGLRVRKDHLLNMQDQLRDAVRDLRRTVGLGRIGWGLRVSLGDGAVVVQPGVAFSPSGVRLNIDSSASLTLPAGAGPWRIALRATESDRESLRLEGQPTLINLVTTPSVEPDDESVIGPDALVIGKVKLVNAKPELSQDPAIFSAAGHHTHSGEFFQDEFGHWHYDGPKLAGTTGTAGLKGDVGPEGPPGNPGEEGAPGEKGDKGDKGDPGAKGDEGDAGAPGEKGDRGDKGDPGAPVAKGDPGAPGEKGDRGNPGAPGSRGDKGETGTPGVTGDAGTPGAAGLKGDKGDLGAPGVKGDAGTPGVKGDKGDRGDPGTPGTKGDAGTPGAAGLKGDKGDLGAPGVKGDAGTPGVKGDTGSPGAAGAKGDPGVPGVKGNTGNAGPPGVKGDTGNPGAAGAKGDPGAAGAKGDKGDKGDKGESGLRGDQGPPGTGLSADWPFIQDRNWRHGAIVSTAQAITILNPLLAVPSVNFSPEILTGQPGVVQVWFEPDAVVTAAGLPGAPVPLLVLHGSIKIDTNSLRWSLTDSSVLVTRAMITGGRVLIRIHCGFLIATDQRPFSAALDGITGIKTLHVPGGILESWFFVRG